MKKILVLIFLVSIFETTFGQESNFNCDEVSVYLNKKSVPFNVAKLSKQEIEKRIMSFIQSKKYILKPFYSNENVISFRDFTTICETKTCGSNLIAKNIFNVHYEKGLANVSADCQIYSSFFGGELVINNNDDVVSKNDVPFGLYEFSIPEQYAKEYPESIYTFNKKGKTKIKNPEIQKIILDFYNQYIIDMKSYLEK